MTNRLSILILAGTAAALLGPWGRPCIAQPASTAPAAKAAAPTEAPADRPVPPPSRKGAEALEDAAVTRRGPTSFDGYVRTLLALAAVVALIFLARLLIRRFGHSGQGVGRSEPVSVISRTSVGPRQQLLLVEMGPKLLLVGASASGFSSLGEVSDPDEVASLLAKAGRKAPMPATSAEDSE